MDPFTILTATTTSFMTALATKGAEGPGRTLDLAWNYSFFTINNYLRQGLVAKEEAQKVKANTKKFYNEIKNNLENIPDENLVNPRVNIVRNSMKAASDNLDEDVIREMYARLIASACDSDKQTKLHPSFIEVIKQLSPEDVKLLEQLRSSEKVPSAEYYTSSNNGGEINLSSYFVLPLVGDYLQTVNALDNLKRLNLASITEGRFLVKESFYEPFESIKVKRDVMLTSESIKTKIMIDSTKNIDIHNPNYDFAEGVKIRKSTVGITSYGKPFLGVCLN